MSMLKKMAIYFFGSVSSKIITFLMMPIIQAVLAPGEKGIFDTISTGLNVVVPVCFFGIWSGVMRYMFDREDLQGKREVFSNGLIIMGGMFPLYLGGVVLMGLFINVEYPILYVALYGIAQAFQYLYQYASRGLGYNKLFMITGLMNTAITTACNILFVVVLKWGYVSLLIAPTVGAFSQAIISEISMKLAVRVRRKHISKDLMKSLMKYCYPIAMNSVAYWLMSSFNQFVVTNQLGPTDAGLNGTSNQFAQILILVTTVFAFAWEETAYANSSSDKRGLLYRDTLKQYLLMLGLGMAVVIPATKLIFPIMFTNPEYAPVLWLIPVRYLGAVASSVSNYYGNIYSAEKRVSTILSSTIVGAVVNIGLLIVLIPLIGLQGSIIALFLGFVANTIMRHIRIQKIIKIPFPWMTLLQITGINAVAFVVYYLGDVWMNLIMAALAGIYALYALRGMIRRLIDKIKNRKNPPAQQDENNKLD